MNKVISTVSTSNTENNALFPALFGAKIFKNTPLFLYAESLFYTGMKQMVNGYQGGTFNLIKLENKDMDFESTGFIPLANKDKTVTIENHFGTSAEISLKAAGIVVWLYVLEQIANNSDEQLMRKLFNVMQDIKYSYKALKDALGNKLFNEADLAGIYTLLD
jgi:hypothetical protein